MGCRYLAIAAMIFGNWRILSTAAVISFSLKQYLLRNSRPEAASRMYDPITARFLQGDICKMYNGQSIPAAVPTDELTTDAENPVDNNSGAIPAWVFAAAAGALAAGAVAWRIALSKRRKKG